MENQIQTQGDGDIAKAVLAGTPAALAELARRMQRPKPKKPYTEKTGRDHSKYQGTRNHKH